MQQNSVVLLSNSTQCLVLIKTRVSQYGLQMTVIRLTNHRLTFDIDYLIMGEDTVRLLEGNEAHRMRFTPRLSNEKHIHDN